MILVDFIKETLWNWIVINMLFDPGSSSAAVNLGETEMSDLGVHE